MFIFDFIGSIFGYVLKFFFDLFSNYGIAIFLFTIFVKIVLLPFSIKTQKTQAQNARMQAKISDLKEKYGADKEKYNQELQKIYQKEGSSPMSGCLPMLIQMPVLLGLYSAVRAPLENVLHLPSELITKATEFLNTLPGVSSIFGSGYPQIEILKHFDTLKEHFTFFSEGQISEVSKYSQGFHFLGLDLFDKPEWTSVLILIPILCFVTSAASSVISQKINGNSSGKGMNGMAIAMSAFSAWISFSVPAAIGLYWIFSNVIGLAQTYIIKVFYNINTINAKAEAQRLALRDLEEKKIIANAGMVNPHFVALGSCALPEKLVNPKQKTTKKGKKK